MLKREAEEEVKVIYDKNSNFFKDEGSAMSQGTWVAICNLPEIFLHNKCIYSFSPFLLYKWEL